VASMSCCEGILLPTKPSERVEVIRPEGATNNGVPKEMDMYYFEAMFGYAPLIFATYPAVALRMPSYDEKQLKVSLAKALKAVPTAAGRFRDNGAKLVLNGAGVPFKVAASSEPSAPEIIEERSLLTFADFYRPAAVRHGRAPLMSIKLTTYKDGSAVLCMCRSHMLFDGTSVWLFLNYWASLGKGEANGTAPYWQRDKVQALMPDLDTTQELAEAVIGKKIKTSLLVPVMMVVMDTLTPIADTLFLHAGVGAQRQRVFLSDQE
ncbi:RAS, partial [Symbiodinium pilosum]